MNHEVETTIIDSLYDRVHDSLSDINNTKKLMKSISEYMDKWSDLLLSTNLSERLLFSDKDKAVLYEVTGISEKEVSTVIKSSNIIKSMWQVANNPFNILSILAMRFFIKNKMNDEFMAISLYFSYPLYTSSHFSSFKHLPNKEIMEYTINNLTNRYILKQTGTIQGMLEHTVMSALEGRYMEELLRCTDKDILDILYAIKVRIHSNIKNIAELFYENHKNEKFIFNEVEVISEDEFHISDNVSFAINRVTTAVSRSIISEGFDYNTVVMRSVNLNAGSSAKKLVAMLNTIVEVDRASISQFVSDILTLFIYKGTGNRIEDIRSMRFISEALQLYKSNAQDEITERIKVKLLEWIELTSNKYGRNFISKGKTSMDTYKRAIYISFVFKIMEVSKGGI